MKKVQATQSQKLMVFVLTMSLYGLATLFTELIPKFQVGIVEFLVEYFLFTSNLVLSSEALWKNRAIVRNAAKNRGHSTCTNRCEDGTWMCCSSCSSSGYSGNEEKFRKGTASKLRDDE